MTVLAENLGAWEATTLAYKERKVEGRWTRVFTVWDKETDTWSVVAE